MKIVAIERLIDFGTNVPASSSALHAWYAEAKSASWAKPTELKSKYGSASILKHGRVVFNICGNKFRLVAQINYEARIIFIRFIGTHADYDEINAHTI